MYISIYFPTWSSSKKVLVMKLLGWLILTAEKKKIKQKNTEISHCFIRRGEVRRHKRCSYLALSEGQSGWLCPMGSEVARAVTH